MNINVKQGSLPKRTKWNYVDKKFKGEVKLLARELKENASLKDLVKKLQELNDKLVQRNDSQAAHLKDVHKWYADNLKELDERTQEKKLYLEEIYMLKRSNNRLKNRVCDLQDNYQKVIKLQKERANK